MAFLQNAWHRDPEKTRRLLTEYDKDPERQKKLRRKLTAYALFAGCKTGKVLTKGLGQTLIDKIIWEESSKDIGSHSSSVFPADLAHIAECYEEFKPDVVVGFGRIAADALIALREEYQIPPSVIFLSAPHPAARHVGVEDEIRQLRFKLEDLEFKLGTPTEFDFA